MAGNITIVGLGSSNEDHLTLGIYNLLKNSKVVYLRTKVHPVAEFLTQEGIRFETFDYLYDTLSEYEQVYMKIASFIIGRAQSGEDIVYAVPGHPMVAEKSVKLLIDDGRKYNISVNVQGGESFIDTFFSRLNIDPIEGFIFLNGETLQRKDLNPSKNIIIGQVYNRFIASDIKLTLMELYPDEMSVRLISNLGLKGKEVIKEVPLYQIDYKDEDFHHLSSLYIPKVTEEHIYERQFSRLTEVIEILRGPEGCPWDRAQTHDSIRKNLIEETYELAETIDELDFDHMLEELGDVLLQVMLHSQIAKEEGYFDIYDVIDQLNKKLIRRHPHVFGDKKAKEEEDALNYWQEAKKEEKGDQNQEDTSILEGIPNLPSILKAYKLQKKAAEVNFDWDDIKEVYLKIDEELEELKSAPEEERIAELGDLLFAIVNLARFLKIDPEAALARTNTKFIRRFQFIEHKLKENGIPIEKATLETMDKYWNEAKTKGIN